jgi:hypothetical protein
MPDTKQQTNTRLILTILTILLSAFVLPFGKSSTGFRKGMIAGWQLNSLAFWQTGIPFTITNASARINLPTITTDRPNGSRKSDFGRSVRSNHTNKSRGESAAVSVRGEAPFLTSTSSPCRFATRWGDLPHLKTKGIV